MKATRHKSVIGLALGDRSLLAAEVQSTGPAATDKREVRHVAEYEYPAGMSLENPAALGKGLGEFLKNKGFTARHAVVGLPARRLVFKAKEVPPADDATLASMLRLQAETEFPAELKDLVFDYNGKAAPNEAGNPTVLLVATPKQQLDISSELLLAAGLNALAVTSTALTLGAATARTHNSRDLLVLSIARGGAELTAQSGTTSTAIRHLRTPDQEKAFAGDLRRAVLPLRTSSGNQDVVLWPSPTPIDTAALGTSLGLTVRKPDVSVLGVALGPSLNGSTAYYAAPVALALGAFSDGGIPIDFLDSRLAPPPEQLVPRWIISAGLAAVLLIGLGTWAWYDLNSRQTALEVTNQKILAQKADVEKAAAYVNTVSVAKQWHTASPRYLACLRDITAAFPEDGATYTTSLIIKEVPKPPSSSGAGVKKPVEKENVLDGSLTGKTADQRHWEYLLNTLKNTPNFSDVKLGTSSNVGRGNQTQVSFTLTFKYRPTTRPEAS